MFVKYNIMVSQLNHQFQVNKDFAICDANFVKKCVKELNFSSVLSHNDAFLFFVDSRKINAEENVMKLVKYTFGEDFSNMVLHQMKCATNNFSKFGDYLEFFSDKCAKIVFFDVQGNENFKKSYENSDKVTFSDLISLASKVIGSIRKIHNVHFIFEDKHNSDFVSELSYRIVANTYEFNRYKISGNVVQNFNFYGDNLDSDVANLAYSSAIMKTFANYAPNELYPMSYALQIKNLLEPLGVKVTIVDSEQLKDLDMYSIYSVGKGSIRKPCAVFMEWMNSDKDSEVISFVGKGVTFDTGGISIKPANKMEEMKFDMSGSACVVAQMYYVAKNKISVNLVGGVGLAENMPGGNAMRPGDVISSMAGKTIEVQNTDAEGRLVLADVLWYVQEKYNATKIIDLATLTGAIVVSLGSEYAGLFSNNDELVKSLRHSGDMTNEKLWQFPMNKEYDRTMDSKFADMKNISSEYSGAGSITAAQFLKRFIKDGVKWAHLDIAGVAYKGGYSSGFGVRLLSKWLSLQGK